MTALQSQRKRYASWWVCRAVVPRQPQICLLPYYSILRKNNTFAKNRMSMPYNLPQRKSPRATWHDYNGGRYFVTFCTRNRDLYFGDIVDGKMEFSEIGEWAFQCIEKIETINDNVFVPEFVVMPNHVHLIVIMDNTPKWSNDGRLPQCDSPTTYGWNCSVGVVGRSYYCSRLRRHSHCRNLRPAD